MKTLITCTDCDCPSLCKDYGCAWRVNMQLDADIKLNEAELDAIIEQEEERGND